MKKLYEEIGKRLLRSKKNLKESETRMEEVRNMAIVEVLEGVSKL